jgi:hypothetical protein
MTMINCSGIAAGVPTLACISAATNYMLGYSILILLTGLLMFRLSAEPMKERMTAILFFTAIFTFMGAIQNMLFPDHFFTISAILFLGAITLLVIRK